MVHRISMGWSHAGRLGKIGNAKTWAFFTADSRMPRYRRGLEAQPQTEEQTTAGHRKESEAARDHGVKQ